MKNVTFKLNVIFKILSLSVNTQIMTFFSALSQNTQRISSSQATQPLATPVVSVTTPSLPPQGLVYSAMPTAYNTGESVLVPFVIWVLCFVISVFFSEFFEDLLIEINDIQCFTFTFGCIKH